MGVIVSCYVVKEYVQKLLQTRPHKNRQRQGRFNVSFATQCTRERQREQTHKFYFKAIL